MDWTAFQIGVLEMALAAVVGMMVVYGGFLLFSRLSPGLNETAEIRQDNRAVAIALGGNLLAVAIIVREALYPISATVQDLALDSWSMNLAFKSLGYVALYLSITAGAAIITMLLAMRAFTLLTRDIDEKAEIAKGNIAAAILYATAAIAIALFVAEGAGSLTKALIPRPKLPDHVLGMPLEQNMSYVPSRN